MHCLGLAALAVATFLASARAVPTVSLTPVSQNIGVGDTAFVDLSISGLGVGPTAPKLGSWLAQIAFNNTIVTITNGDVVFGTNLDLGVFGTTQGADASTPGLLNLDQVSYEDSTALIASQPDAFSLATLKFTGVAPGITSLTFSQLQLGDELGFPLAASSTPASITVGSVGVPDGGAITLMGAVCLAALCFAQAHRPRGMK